MSRRVLLICSVWCIWCVHRYLPVGGALFVSSGAFALCHLGSCGVSELPLLMGMGAVLGALYLRTGNLMAPVAAHAFHNACAMIAA